MTSRFSMITESDSNNQQQTRFSSLFHLRSTYHPSLHPVRFMIASLHRGNDRTDGIDTSKVRNTVTLYQGSTRDAQHTVPLLPRVATGSTLAQRARVPLHRFVVVQPLPCGATPPDQHDQDGYSVDACRGRAGSRERWEPPSTAQRSGPAVRRSVVVTLRRAAPGAPPCLPVVVVPRRPYVYSDARGSPRPAFPPPRLCAVLAFRFCWSFESHRNAPRSRVV